MLQFTLSNTKMTKAKYNIRWETPKTGKHTYVGKTARGKTIADLLTWALSWLTARGQRDP